MKNAGKFSLEPIRYLQVNLKKLYMSIHADTIFKTTFGWLQQTKVFFFVIFSPLEKFDILFFVVDCE